MYLVFIAICWLFYPLFFLTAWLIGRCITVSDDIRGSENTTLEEVKVISPKNEGRHDSRLKISKHRKRQRSRPHRRSAESSEPRHEQNPDHDTNNHHEKDAVPGNNEKKSHSAEISGPRHVHDHDKNDHLEKVVVQGTVIHKEKHLPLSTVSTLHGSIGVQTFANQQAISGKHYQPSRKSSHSTNASAPLPSQASGNNELTQRKNSSAMKHPHSSAEITQLLSNWGGVFRYICGKCFSCNPPQVKVKHKKGSHCNGTNKHPWDECKVMVHTIPDKLPVLIRPRPVGLPMYCDAKLCFRRKYCVESDCRFAHSSIEADIWNLRKDTYEDVVAFTRKSPTGVFSCDYCKISFREEWELQNHINTPEHKTNINSDKGRLWRHREPPGNIINGNFKLCPSVIGNRLVSCPFSDAVPADNPCIRAHSMEELEEWRERHQYRHMKITKAKEQKIFSFMNQIQAEYGAADFEIEVITEDVPTGVAIDCKHNSLVQYIQEIQNGVYTHAWKFIVQCSLEKPLIRVGLLRDEYRLHFYLSSPENMREPQVCPGSKIFRQRPQGSEYHISVIFKSKILGRFKQWVVFDFGSRPVVKREITVHVGGHLMDNLKAPEPCETKVWDDTNVKIIPFFPNAEKLRALKIYKVSDSLVAFEGYDLILSKNTYKQTMHQLLQEEEKARQILLAKFSMETEMEVANMVSIESASSVSCLYAQDGQLFGKIDITQSILGDSDAGQIALTSVEMVLIKFNPMSSTVYEARIVSDEADGLTKDAIYVRLNATCVEDMLFAPASKVRVQVQFRLNRLHFCTMHWAIDQLSNTDILFPTKNEHPALICPQQDTDTDGLMNRWQEGAVRFIREKGGFGSKTPWLLLYGPFGTGKTYTLANGVMSALKDTDSRILICTHNNSAADLYITEYLDNFVKNWTGPIALKMLRIYPDIRSRSTIPREVQKYMLFDTNERIKTLNERDILGHRIVVTTTTTAHQLASFARLRGYFTHILIDEVAQVLETEALIPLILATPTTCVVLTGDHIQTGPKVYSKQARKMKFHQSLLERLFDYCLRKKCHRQILLRSNYRTHQTILTFLSKVFYCAEDLEACSKQPRHPEYYPLEFRVVKGDDMMIGKSYVNSYEVSETVYRVQEILDTWPEELWGPKAPGDIGVLTPYRLQVQQLRRELRNRGLPGVFVDRLEGVQGKQFRVVVINTVRTQATINTEDTDPEAQYYLGFLSDMRQLNTAFTRTQSLVVVVGNPITLCSIGECCTVWKKYIKECEENQSLYPRGTAYKDIRLDIAAATTTLNPNAAAFIPIADSSSFGVSESKSTVSSTSQNETDEIVVEQTMSDDESEDIDFNKDDVILQELRRQIRKDRRRKNGEDGDSSEGETDEEEEMPTMTNFRMIEEDDHVRIVHFQDEIKRTNELQTGIIKPCIFRMDNDGRRYAIPEESTDQMTEIHIGNHTQRGTAMDGDEVLVEILAKKDAEENNMNKLKGQYKVYGKVLSVQKRAVDLTEKKLICLADRYSDNLMVPVNRRLPKIMILHPGRKTRRTKQSPGHLVVPICRLSKSGVIRKRDVVVSNKDRPHKLFTVKWLKWNKEFHYPLGIAIDDLQPGNTQQEGLKILKQIYEVGNQSMSMDCSDRFALEWTIPDEEYQRRLDIRKLLVFTIDHPDTQDIDDALSVQKLQSGKYMVGVHIADVSYFVRCETDTDAKAREMATSVYPDFAEPIHMLPSRLSTDLCSLKPGLDRLTISVFFIMNESGSLIPDETKIQQSVICSKGQFTYDEVEQLIVSDNDVHGDEMKESIKILGRLAWGRRNIRLGNARFAHDDSDSVSHPRAHSLVEEMMLLTNETIARFLLSKFPQCIPLRRQPPPSTEYFNAWKEANHERIELSALLTHKRDVLEEILKENIQPLSHENGERDSVIRILKETWEEMKMKTRQSDIRRLGGLVFSDQYHPQFAPVRSAFHRILQSSEYFNSGNLTPEAYKHSSLNIDAYTHFTSPIRRYIDIVVHRFVVAAITVRVPPHNADDVAKICHNCNTKCFLAREFEMKTHALNLAIALKDHPLEIPAVIERLTDKSIQVGFCHDYNVSKAMRHSSIGFNLMKPIIRPELKEGDGMTLMKWKERLYHVDGMPALKPHDIRANQSKRVNLQIALSHRFTVEIPVGIWHSISRAIVNDDLPQIRQNMQVAESQISSRDTPIQATEPEEFGQHVLVENVTCETSDATQKKKYYVQFEHAFQVGGVNMVQLYPTFNRGLLSPNVQLYQVTPTFDICIEHRSNPVQCLSSIADEVPDRKNIETYQETWIPIIAMMSAYNAVQENETIVIHGVKIEWQYHPSVSLPTGSFSLYRKFCEERHIELSPKKASGCKAAYLCIRYSGERSVHTVEQGHLSSPEEHQPMTFVAHAKTLDIKEAEEKKDWEKSTITIFFEVNQMSAPFPKILKRGGHHPRECTVEIMPVCYPDSRLEAALRDLKSTSSLVKNVCLLTPDKAECDGDVLDMEILVSQARNRETFNVPNCVLNRLNRPQIEAVKTALTNRFTVIQGPPGTGKTVTGAYLVYFFTEHNKQLPNRGKGRPQILYCGPSNKSVDVIAEYLKMFKIPIVRVYSKGIESREFPIPGLPNMTGKMDSKDVTMDPRHKKISLHHLIRMKKRLDGLRPNSKCQDILAYDRRFRNLRNEPQHREIKQYQKTIFRAEIEELQKYQVILTTCNAAGSNRIIEATNIQQCIIDEAGMCSEPETSIPLVSTNPLQIVLIGDHKQLRPIIQEPTARLLGGEISLLQQYTEQMNMLTIQYRMHEAICHFPSTEFYNGRLLTPPTVRQRPLILPHDIWPGDGSRPIAFCHCSGPEETLSVRTAEGNEMSKANQCEVDQVVRMTKILVDRYKVSAKDIVVLSQYRLQCDKISKSLHACGKADVSVRTVIQSQGSEWRFVIMSTVRSLPRVEIEENPNYGWRKKFLGFITDENQMNVALTRAKHGLIIVGNRYLLRTHKRWKALLDHYEENNCVVKADLFLR